MKPKTYKVLPKLVGSRIKYYIAKKTIFGWQRVMSLYEMATTRYRYFDSLDEAISERNKLMGIKRKKYE